MSESSVGPALTPEEWTRNLADLSMSISRLGDECSPIYTRREKHWDDPANCHHALAALCLYSQPFGFTQADIQLLVRAGPEAPGYYETEWTADEIAQLDSLIARIASLLPPHP